MSLRHPAIFLALLSCSPVVAQAWTPLPAYVPATAVSWDPVRERLLLAGSDAAQQPRLHEWDGLTARERPEELLGQPIVEHLLTDRPGRRVLALSTNGQVGTWNGGGWAWRTGGTVPPTGVRLVAYDEHRQRLVVLTGDGFVHEWDGSTWWHIGTPLGFPIATAAFAYDPNSRRSVLYYGPVGSPAQTWTWDGFTWSLVSAASAPGPRSRPGFAFDPVQQQELVLYGGNSTSQDTWAFGGGGWHLLTSAPAVGPLEECRLVAGGQGPVLLAGSGPDAGAVWRLVGQQWSLQGRLPLAQNTGREPLAVDPVRGTIVAFGGFGVFDRTWLPVAPAHRPPGRAQGHLAFCHAAQHLLAFGGLATGGAVGDTWTWDGIDWQAHTSGASPAPRYRGMMAEGPNGTVVLFGGVDGATYLGDTWVWDGLGWQQQTPAVAPAPRAYALAAFDQPRATMVMWGGYNLTTTYGTQTWTWDGTAWTLTASTTQLANASSCFFHAGIGAVVAVGNAASWEWNGTNWLPRAGYGITAPRSVIYHARRNQVVELSAEQLGPTARALVAVRSDVTPYGNGCAIGAAPAIAVVGAPRPDSALDLELTTRVPHAAAFLITGLSTQSVSVGGGCRALVGTTLGVHLALANAAGIVRLPLTIPDDPSLRGMQFAAQGAVFDPLASPIGSVTTSAGLLLTLGD